jgi:hypothetical protein
MTAASALIAELPANHGGYEPDGLPVRDRLILDMLSAGEAPPYEWVQIVSSSPRGTLRLLVGADAVKIGDETDSIRVNLSQLAAQRLADRSDCLLLTPKLNDLRWESCGAKLTPSNIAPYPADKTEAMVQHSRMIDAKLPEGYPPNMLVGNVGKGAVNSTLLWQPPNPTHMAIYGWHVPKTDPLARTAATPTGGYVIQRESIKHLANFVDYSATVVYARREAELATEEATRVVDLADIALDPEWCDLVSASGPVIMRHPAIPCPDPTALVGGAVEPAACPLPPGGTPPIPAPSAAPAVPTAALVAGGVGLALAVAYYATKG